MVILHKYGVALTLRVPIIKRAAQDYALGTDWTPAAGDVKVMKDGGVSADIGTLPAATAIGNTAYWTITLTATEMQAAEVVVTISDAATKTIEDQFLIIQTYGNASARHAFDLGTANVIVGTNNDKTGYALSTAGVQAIWDALTTALTTANSIGKRLADNIDALVSSRATPAQVNAEVLDVLNVDTFPEPGQGAPPATATLVQKLGYVYKAWRNKSTQTATLYSLFNDDAVTVDQKAATSDDGTTFSRDEIATGP